MTQCEYILRHLKAGASLTPAEALRRYHCFRLAARVKELRAAGFPIVTDRVRTRGGAIVARYRL